MAKSASLKKRIIAALVDYGLYFLFFWLYVTYFGEKTAYGFEVTGLKALPLLIIWIIYFPFWEFLFSQTLGKYLMSISIVKVNDQNLTFLDSLKRRIIDPLDFFFFGIVGIIAQKNTALHQRIGDLWANAQVIENGVSVGITSASTGDADGVSI